MATTDPNIILDAVPNTPQWDPSQAMSMFSFARQVQDWRQQDQARNALRQVFTDPNSVDPKTNLPTPNALRRIMQVSPEMGMKLQDQTLESQAQQLQLQLTKTKAGEQKFNFGRSAQIAGITAYEDAKKAGKSEQDSRAAGQAALSDYARAGGGVVGDETVQAIVSQSFDPSKARAISSTDPEYLKARTEAEREKHDEATEKIGAQRLTVQVGDQQAAKWQVLTDPTKKDAKGNPVQYRYNPETAQSTTLDGKQPYEPGGAEKLGGGGLGSRPRSGQVMYLQKFMEEHPGATSEDIKTAMAGYREEQSESGTVGTRSGAADVAAKDVEIFAKQARDASKALPRTDIALANEVLQNWDMKTSNPQLRQLMIAADALVNSRARAISPTGSPHVNDQLEGRKMLAAAFASGDFEAAVEQMEKEAAGVKQATKETKAELSGSSASSLPAAAVAKLSEGQVTTFANGQRWTLKNGQPEQVK